MRRSILLSESGKCAMTCNKDFTEVNFIKSEILFQGTIIPAQSFTFRGIDYIRDMYCFLGEMIENYDKIKELQDNIELKKKEVLNSNYEKDRDKIRKEIDEIIKQRDELLK